MSSLDAIYTAEWFAHDFEHLQPEFDAVADAIFRQFQPEMVTDVGCGPGMILRRLQEYHVDVDGIEGSKHGIAYADPKVRLWLNEADVTTLRTLGHYRARRRVVICTEVAEHLDEKHAAGLVALLCSAMCPIVFTAAPPGQDGHHHVNCQPMPYWQRLFNARGAILDADATHELARRWAALQRLSHMTQNVAVFR